MKYKSFREQFLECKESGNLIRVSCSIYKGLYKNFPDEILVCIKHKSICHSGVCRSERMKIKWSELEVGDKFKAFGRTFEKINDKGYMLGICNSKELKTDEQCHINPNKKVERI